SDESKTPAPGDVLPYLNEIAERLWTNRAAIMVGSGFSKNASTEYPDWNQLGDIFYERVYGTKPGPEDCKYMNVMRLAEEVESAIGRPALENLIRSSIPDECVEPSKLHTKLLELPWVDVFTTNYDTLLDRASAKISTRKYEIVTNKEDIPYATKPRIVKLHGSFPSQRPFVITEEDYRRYPDDYSPFVNTVQQSLLENTICLIGFSGTDPNFLKWIGWIRDNLGIDQMQKIYLVGLFNFSIARIQLFAKQGIVVVDMSRYTKLQKSDHTSAIHEFIEYMTMRNPNSLDWPRNSSTVHIFPNHKNDTVAELKDIVSQWKKQRENYPGWLIVPYQNRQKLWQFTQYWIDFLSEGVTLPPGLDILYAHELIWRLEKCLMPLLCNLDTFARAVLAKYWPFVDQKPLALHQFDARNKNPRVEHWEDIRKAWIEISLSLLRFYREEGKTESWRQMYKQLKGLSEFLSKDQLEFLHYENYLFHLFSLEITKAKEILMDWEPKLPLSYWLTKRAAALAEIDSSIHLDEQLQISLASTRESTGKTVFKPDYTNASYEAYQMLLNRFIKNSHHFDDKEQSVTEYEKDQILRKYGKHVTSQEFLEYLKEVRNEENERERKQDNARWDELKAIRCDPWNELRVFELLLRADQTSTNKTIQKHGFDIGSTIATTHFDDFDQKQLHSYSFLRFCEEIGLPFRVGINSIGISAAKESIKSISTTSPFWAIATMFRVADEKVVEYLFNRDSMYTYSRREADELVLRFSMAYKENLEGMNSGDAFLNDHFEVHLSLLLPEVLSRLCCKCSLQAKYKILHLIQATYSSPKRYNYKNVSQLTKRLLKSLSTVEQYKMIPYLLNISYQKPAYSDFGNPLAYIDIDHKPKCVKQPLHIKSAVVDDLLLQSASTDPKEREWATTSLVKLYTLQLLNGHQEKKLGEVLWMSTSKNCFPENTHCVPSDFVHLPHPDTINPFLLFEEYVRKTPFPIQKFIKSKGVDITRGHIPIVQEIILAKLKNNFSFSKQTTADLLHRLVEWWEADKDQLVVEEKGISANFSVREEFFARFKALLLVVTIVIGPQRSEESSNEDKSCLLQLLDEMKEYGLPTHRAEVSCFQLFPERRTAVYEDINKALFSNIWEMEEDALWALAIMIKNNTTINTDSFPDPITMFNQYMLWCQMQHVHTLIKAVNFLVKNSTDKVLLYDSTLMKLLNKLLIETDYDNKDSSLSTEAKLEIRYLVAELSVHLWRYYHSHKLPVPEVLRAWKKTLCSSHEFAEVRNVWRE
nr:SIR2 family protein [Caldisericia bacterium]